MMMANIGRLCVVEERHETEVHVQLLVAVEESKAGIVGNEVNLRLLVATQHRHVFMMPAVFIPARLVSSKLWR
jgi:hypothetical protein